MTIADWIILSITAGVIIYGVCLLEERRKKNK